MARDAESSDNVWRSRYQDGPLPGPSRYGTPPPFARSKGERRRARVLGGLSIVGVVVMLAAIASFIYSMGQDEGANIGAPIIFMFGAFLVGVGSAL